MARRRGSQQALLDRAQQGGLAPQNTGDEPAEKLLERVRAARPRERERQRRQRRVVVSIRK